METFPAKVNVFTDGCAKGNPGPAGAGFVIEDLDGNPLAEDCEALGHATNNEAEYRALILAMQRCVELKIETAYFFTDSELMAKQIGGVYKIKNKRLAELAREVQGLRRNFKEFQIAHIPRERNQRADDMANAALAT